MPAQVILIRLADPVLAGEVTQALPFSMTCLNLQVALRGGHGAAIEPPVEAFRQLSSRHHQAARSFMRDAR